MKILLISNMYPSSNAPTYGTFVEKTFQTLYEQQDIVVKKIVLYKEEKKFLKILKYLKYYIKIILTILFKKYDIIYVHYASHNALPILIASHVKNLKIISNVHGSDVVPETWIQRQLQLYVGKLLNKSNIIITPSVYFKELIFHKYTLESERIAVYPSGGISNEIFAPKTIEAKEILNKVEVNSRYIGYVGRIDQGKGWDDLILAFNELKKNQHTSSLKLIIVGSGKQVNDLEKLIKLSPFKKDIIRFDSLEQKKLVDIYNVLDVFIFPSKRDGESLGLVGLEAMACGVPVIGSNVGGIMSYLDNYTNGLLFEKGDFKELSNKIIEFFSIEKEEIEALKKNAIATASKYDSNAIKFQFLNIFREVYNEKK